MSHNSFHGAPKEITRRSIIFVDNQKVNEMNEYEHGRKDVLLELLTKFNPSRPEPSVDCSNPGDIVDHATWTSDNYHYNAIQDLLDTMMRTV